VVDAGLRGGGVAFGFRQDKRALEHHLHMERQTFGGPRCANAIAFHCLGNVGGHFGGMAADAGIAGAANVGMGIVGFLNHRAHEAGEFRDGAAQKRFAEVQVTENAFKRIVQPVIRSSGKKRLRNVRPLPRCRDGERIFGRKVVEERALCHPGAGTQRINGGCGVTSLADHRHRGGEKFGACAIRRGWLNPVRVHDASYQPVGMCQLP
jgi:hypothetical protein